MKGYTLVITLHLFGLVGYAAIGLIPYRSWKEMMRMIKANNKGIIQIIFLFFIISFALWFDFMITRDIYSCLAKSKCGPSLASGLIYLAVLGAIYLVFELLIFLLKKTVKIVQKGFVQGGKAWS